MKTSFHSLRRAPTLAGIIGLAATSLVLLCGAGSAPLENFAPQGVMQNDLNAGGHSVTNAAMLSATNVTVSGTLTAANLGSAATNAASAFAPATGSSAYAPATGSANYDAAGTAAAALATAMQKANNLSDLANPATARTNLGLNTAATNAASAFAPATGSGAYAPATGSSAYAPATGSANYDAAGTAAAALATALQKANNLSDLANPATARTNLGLNTAATNASSAFAPASGSTSYAPILPQGQMSVSPAQPIGLLNQRAVGDGDSITFGAGANSGNARGGTAIPEQSYPSILQRLGFYSRGTVYNFGESGYTTAQGVGLYATSTAYPGVVMGASYTGSPHALAPNTTGIAADFLDFYGKNDQRPVAFTGNVANGSNQITSIVMTTGTSSQIANGSAIESLVTGLPATPTLTTFAGTTATLSGNWTGTTATGVAFNINVPVTSFASWQASKQSLWSSARADGYRVVVLSLIPSGNTNDHGSPFGEGFRATWNAWLAQQKYNGTSVTSGWDVYVDTSSVFNQVVLAGDPYYSTDYLHPSYRGNQAIAALVDRQMWLQTHTTPSYYRYPEETFAHNLANSHTIYVSLSFGTDYVRSDISKYSITAPFYTLCAALAAAVAGDNVVILDGALNEANVTLKNNVNIAFAPGTSWGGQATGSLLQDGGNAVSCTISGNGQTLVHGAAFAQLLNLTGNGTSLIFSNLNLTTNANSGSVILFNAPNESVKVINGNVSSTYAGTSAIALNFSGASSNCAFIGVGSGDVSCPSGQAIYFGGAAGAANTVVVAGSLTSNYRAVEVYDNNLPTLNVLGTVNGGTGQAFRGDYNYVTATVGRLIEGSSYASSGAVLTILSPVPVITNLANPSTTSFTQAFTGMADQTINLTQTGGAMASGTFTLPADSNTRVSEICEIANNSASAITSLSVTVSGGTVYGVPSSLAAGQRLQLKKIAANVWSAK